MNNLTPPLEKSIVMEAQVINLALYDKHACSLLSELTEDIFINNRHKAIKKTIDRMLEEKKSISPGSVYNELVNKDLKDYFVSISQDQLISDVDTAFMQFGQFHRMAKMLPMIENIHTICADGKPEFDDKFDELTDFFSSSKVAQEAVRIKDLMVKKPEEVRKNLFRTKTGIPSLDEHVKFFYGGQYICVAGAPGGGKSTIAIQIAENIPESLVMSYEMSAEEIHDILISRNSRIDSEKIEAGSLTFQEKQVIESVRRRLSNDCTLSVNDKSLNMADMFAYIKRHTRKYGTKCVVIDYAQIIPGIPGKGTQTERYEYLSRRFKNLARELNIIIIALSQLSKDSLRDGRAPTLADLRGSLSFGADADKVIFLYEIPDEDNLGRGQVQLSFGKNRKGRIGKVNNFFYQKEIHWMR